MYPFYAEDLAYIHHTGFSRFAREAAPGLIALLHRAGIRGGLVVDLGCGSGVWAQAFLAAGYDVIGVDCSPDMIRLARSVAPAARFVEASLHTFALPPCRAVTAIGEGFNYLVREDPREALPRLFSRIHQALTPGGLLLFDVVLRSERQPMRYRKVLTGADWRVEVEVDEDPEQSLLTRRIRTVRRLGEVERQAEETHRVRTFSPAELQEALRGCGFTLRVQRRYGGMLLAPQRMGFQARKRPHA